jgi:predicted nicotinamide N-methyase
LKQVLGPSNGDLGNQFWDNCYFMTRWLERKCQSEKNFLRNKRVVELGAGLGLLGMCASLFDASMILTDVGNSVLDNLKQNLQTNSKTNVNNIAKRTAVLELKWADESQMQSVLNFDWKSIGYSNEKENFVDIIIGSDIIAGLYDLNALLSTFVWFCERNNELEIYVAYKPRPFVQEQKFFHQAKKYFEIEEMNLDLLQETDKIGDDSKILRFRKNKIK